MPERYCMMPFQIDAPDLSSDWQRHIPDLNFFLGFYDAAFFVEEEIRAIRKHLFQTGISNNEDRQRLALAFQTTATQHRVAAGKRGLPPSDQIFIDLSHG